MARDMLAGTVALITGAGQGVGDTVAREFAAEGASVALFERNPATLAQVVDDLRANGTPVEPCAVDITDYAALKNAVDHTLRTFGRIDVLVNNAGVFRSGSILDDTLEDWRFVLDVNLEALSVLTRLVVPSMVAQRHGRIINVSSIAGTRSRGNVGSYNASKGAVIAFTKSLAVELTPCGIQANAIAPGFLRTAQMQDAQGNDLTQSADFVAWYIRQRRIPMQRAGEPQDVAGTAVFLASEYCRYVTGQVFVVDGGLTATF